MLWESDMQILEKKSHTEAKSAKSEDECLLHITYFLSSEVFENQKVPFPLKKLLSEISFKELQAWIHF